MTQNQIALQWTLDRTADDVIKVSWGAIRAATSENVQILPILAASKFGATLAMSRETCDQIEGHVLTTPPHWTVQFLKSSVGFNDNDCASEIGKSQAGVQFLGLACALITTMSPYKGATAIREMLRSTNKKDEIPSTVHLRDLLSALRPRCTFSGFAADVVRCQTAIEGAMFTSGSFGYRTNISPSPEAIKELVDAFRVISRIGEAEICGLEIKVNKCAAWVTAFTKWCIGEPAIYLEAEGQVRHLIQSQSACNVTVIVPATPDNFGYCVTINRLRSVGMPTELICPSEKSEQEWSGMVDVRTYGKWLLRQFDFDRGRSNRLLHSILPYSIYTVLSSLTFPNFESAIDEPWHLDSEERRQRVLDLCPTPFPSLATISRIYSLYFDADTDSPSVIQNDQRFLSVADIPQVQTYLDDLQSCCRCDSCRSAVRDESPMGGVKCAKDIFFYRLAKIIGDILTMSLFHLPETLRVELSRYRYQDVEEFVSHIIAVVKYGQRQDCDVRSILASARSIIGHQHLDKELPNSKSDWILTCDRGQAAYPVVFDSFYIERKGYLSIICCRGVLQYDKDDRAGEKWMGVIGVEETWGPSAALTVSADQVLSPTCLFPRSTVMWEVSKKDVSKLEARIVIKEGDRKSETTRNPINLLLGIQYGMIVESCRHSPDDRLSEPERLCVYVGPESAPGFRSPGHTVVVPVSGAHHLRFFAMPGEDLPRPFVLRQGACLRCSLEVCKRSSARLLIL